MKFPGQRLWIPALGLVVLAAWFAGIAGFTDAAIRRFEGHMRPMAAAPEAPRAWCAQRFFVEPDSYYWLADARELRARGAWRMRATTADNAPYGREMHWSHLPIWGLMATSRLLESAAGMPSPLALEWAGRILLPAAGAAFLGILFLLLGRRLGWPVAALATGALAAAPEILWNFHALRPDHHGFHLAFAAGMWLCLALGGMGRARPGARRWFATAGLLGAAALWTGATVFLFSLCAAAGAAAFVRLAARTDDAPGGWDPDLWRWWAMVGAGAGLFFYALEYAPAHFSMRLEVNHPLHALCWLGLGESLRALFAWKADGRAPDRKTAVLGAAGLLAAAALPALILFGPVEWYWPRTEIMLRLHARHILEFRPLQTVAGNRWLWAWVQAAGVGVPALAGAAWLLAKRRPDPWREPLAGLWAIAVFFTGMYFWQVRWAPFAIAASLLLAAFWLAALRGSGHRRLSAAIAALLAVQIAAGTVQTGRPLLKIWRVETIDALWLKTLLQRNALLQLRENRHGVPMRLMATPELAPAIRYFGVGDSVGSLYWENPEGLAATAAFFGDVLPGARAREIARERGVTHALITVGAFDALMFQHLATGRYSEPEAAATVGGAAAQSGAKLPDWLQAEPDLATAANQTYGIAVPAAGGWVPANLPVQIYRVAP